MTTTTKQNRKTMPPLQAQTKSDFCKLSLFINHATNTDPLLCPPKTEEDHIFDKIDRLGIACTDEMLMKRKVHSSLPSKKSSRSSQPLVSQIPPKHSLRSTTVAPITVTSSSLPPRPLLRSQPLLLPTSLAPNSSKSTSMHLFSSPPCRTPPPPPPTISFSISTNVKRSQPSIASNLSQRQNFQNLPLGSTRLRGGCPRSLSPIQEAVMSSLVSAATNITTNTTAAKQI